MSRYSTTWIVSIGRYYSKRFSSRLQGLYFIIDEKIWKRLATYCSRLPAGSGLLCREDMLDVAVLLFTPE